jgi:hypothetical protein
MCGMVVLHNEEFCDLRRFPSGLVVKSWEVFS